ncbi:mediator of DNA damage checkpoint protein 1 isoform X3 [Fukomys damarensis]|uniref:mediator of DNA damage checkpoint protein 1 isoform X3 n=1 Tax=Fukomys damarensis TaxID=885580 RepID=UPI00053FEDAD|nr:mediator of DNA damage checkpoint protein 1 isoform X3 [Fukomys damarensis]
MYPENLQPYQAMEDTQTIDWAVEEEEEIEQSSDSLGCSLEPIGQLRVFGGAYGPEKDFPLYLGKNVVGRMPDCSVALPFPSISKQHAVIEISARNKAPVLQDCGSLNGTQILRPPRVLSPGVSHPLRNHELILFADLPCQYRRLDVPLPVGSRGPLTVEETPRVLGAARAARPPLAEDSEEEADFSSERCMEKDSRTASSPLTTVVPESDDEGPSPAPGGSAPSLAFNLDSDTDKNEAAKPFSVVRNSATKAEQPGGDRVTRDPRPIKAPPAVERDKDMEVRRDARNKVVLKRSHCLDEDSDTDVDEDSGAARLHLKAQPSGFMDSDSDVEEGIPVTPAAVPVKKRPIFHVAGRAGPGAPGAALVQESPAGSDAGVEEHKPPPAGSQTSMAIDSDTDDEEEVSAALTLARLKESGAIRWKRDSDAEKARAQLVVSLEHNQTALGKDSDTDVEEERLPVGKRETVPSAYTEKGEGPVTAHSGESRLPHGDSDVGRSSHGTHPERSQASPATVHIKTEAEEDVPPAPAVSHLESCQVSVEEDAASAVAAVRQSKPLAKGDAHETSPEVGAPSRAPVTQGEQVVHTGTPGNPTPPQRAGAQTPAGRKRKSYLARTGGSRDSSDDCEDLDLQATQCFVENESLEGALDEPWEILATQPFCVGEPEASAAQPMTTFLEACRPHQHPGSSGHTKPLGTKGRATQTVERDRGTAGETAERVTPERGTPERDIQEWLPGESPDELEEEELTRRIKDREQKQVLAGAAQSPESGRKVESVSPERGRASPTGEVEASEETGEEDVQRETPAREALEGVVEKSGPEAERGLAEAGLAVALETGETERGHGDPEEQAARASPEPGVGVECQSGGARGAPGSPSGQPRGHVDGKIPPVEHASGGDLESPDACLPAATPEASIPPPGPFPSQRPLSPRASSEPAIPRARRTGRRQAPEPAVSSELETFPPKPSVRCRPSSRTAPASLSSAAHTPQPHLPTPAQQPAPSEPTSRASQARTRRSSAKSPEAFEPTAPELQPTSPTDQPVLPKPTPRAVRGRRSRSSVKAPEAADHTAPELQLSASTCQPDTPGPPARATRGRMNRPCAKTPEAAEPAAPKLQPSTSTGQPVTPKPTPQGRTTRSSAKTAEPADPKVQPSTSTHQAATPQATQGRPCKSSVRSPEPVFPTSSELQPPSTDQPVSPEPAAQATRGRTRRSSVTTPEVAKAAAPKLQLSASTDQPVAPKHTPRATRGQIRKSSVETLEPSAADMEPPTSTDQPVTPETIAQGRAPREPQPPVTTDYAHEPIPRASCGRKQRAAGKHGSLTAPGVHQPCSEPADQSTGNQRAGRPRAAASLGTVSGPSFPQLPEAPVQVLLVPKTEAADSPESTPEPRPAASQRHKRPYPSTNLPPLLKWPQREGSPKTVFPKEEEEDTAERPRNAEDVVTPGPGKRKRDQTEPPREVPKRGLRRNKPTQSSATPRVLFTGVLDARGEQAVLGLGGSLASSVAEASHLVTDRIRRTVKFLCALGRGIPILSLEWLHQSQKAGHFLPPDRYVVTDPEQEKNFGFRLQDALTRAREQRLLEGYEIHVTAGVQPPPLQMAEIITCCGGTVLPSMPRSYKPRRVVITCTQDFPRCSPASRAGLPLLSPEFLLTGVLKQEAKPEAFILSARALPST